MCSSPQACPISRPQRALPMQSSFKSSAPRPHMAEPRLGAITVRKLHRLTLLLQIFHRDYPQMCSNLRSSQMCCDSLASHVIARLEILVHDPQLLLLCNDHHGETFPHLFRLPEDTVWSSSYEPCLGFPMITMKAPGCTQTEIPQRLGPVF